MWALPAQVRTLPSTLDLEIFLLFHNICKCENFRFWIQARHLLVAKGMQQVLVPEWLSGMTRNHVGSARAGSNPAEHVSGDFATLFDKIPNH
jgi:hypothetical protein